MPGPIKIRFFLGDQQHPVLPRTRLWCEPLPQTRRNDSFPAGDSNLSYGQYFTAVRHFLLQEQVQTRLQDLATAAGSAGIASIAVYLEKHGRFYHPARVEAASGDQSLNFVLNVAVSAEGRTGLRNDVQNIQQLQIGYPYSFLPQIYHYAEIGSDVAGQSLSMALGEWLNGFFEFHLTDNPQDRRQNLVVWDPDRGRTGLSDTQTEAVYRQTAMILAAYLNPDTFAHIRHWHHAAGDFVVQLRGDRIRVRLVTVRDYGPLFGGLEVSVDNVFELLTLYLVNTALRLGLDRCDGTGAPVWAGNIAVGAAVEGTLDGLRLQAEHDIVPVELASGISAYIKGYPVEELGALCRAVLLRWPAGTLGRDLLLVRTGSVAAQLHGAIQHPNERL